MLTAGVDEAGRGPWAGPVYAAAVILDPARPIGGLADSKKLSAAKRGQLFDVIQENALSWAIATASVEEIDSLNILQASLLARRRAGETLRLQPGFVYVDGLHCPRWHYLSAAVVKGDSKVDCIAAASIIAKVTRDREMVALDYRYPGYGFAKHMGYPTMLHLQALQSLGPCEIHRRSFKPVQQVLSVSR